MKLNGVHLIFVLLYYFASEKKILSSFSNRMSFPLFLFSNLIWHIKWAASWQNQRNGMCAQRRLRSAQWVAKDLSFLQADSEVADAQVDLSLRWAHKPFCWFCHEAAQISHFSRVCACDTPVCLNKRYTRIRPVWSKNLVILASFANNWFFFLLFIYLFIFHF